MTTVSTTVSKPVWPYPEIVRLNAHTGSGQWRKSLNGKDYYFGPLDDPDEALSRWRLEWPRIVSGLPRDVVIPQGSAAGCVTIHAAVNAFLHSKREAMERGELAWQTMADYQHVARIVCGAMGDRAPLGSIGPVSFADVLRSMSKLSAIKRANNVVKVRSIIRWICDQYGVTIRIPYDFKGPPMRMRRIQRHGRSGRVFTPEQIARLLEHADTVGKAIVLLGINAGYRNSDLAETRTDECDLKKGWIRQLRAKTAAERIVPLWPETKAAIRGIHSPDRPLLLVGKTGLKLVRRGRDDVRLIFKSIAEKAKVEGTFAWMRYTFSTVASETGDDHARDIIMGHTIDSVPESYVLRFPVHRLTRVSDHVRAWVFGGKQGPRPGHRK